MSLTQTQIVNAQPREKTYRLFDGAGLYLEVSPRGGKWWRTRYHIGGRDKRLSLGVFAMVGLKLARQRCLELRSQLVTIRRSCAKQLGAGRCRELKLSRRLPVNDMSSCRRSGVIPMATGS
jgi:hypothetical protein